MIILVLHNQGLVHEYLSEYTDCLACFKLAKWFSMFLENGHEVKDNTNKYYKTKTQAYKYTLQISGDLFRAIEDIILEKRGVTRDIKKKRYDQFAEI